MARNIRMRVIRHCLGSWYYGIYDGRKRIMDSCKYYGYGKKKEVIKLAKDIAKKIGIPYDHKVVRQHGC